MMIGLNSSELTVLELFKTNAGQVLDLDTVAESFYGDRPRPKNWRKSVMAFMRMLRVKCEIENKGTIERTSRLGAASKAEYVYQGMMQG